MDDELLGGGVIQYPSRIHHYQSPQASESISESHLELDYREDEELFQDRYLELLKIAEFCIDYQHRFFSFHNEGLISESK